MSKQVDPPLQKEKKNGIDLTLGGKLEVE